MHLHIKGNFITFFLTLLLLFSLLQKGYSYSVFTHEAVIDASWDSVIKPFLLSKYKDATAEDLKNAKAFAYGGSIVPDMGYYPLGSKLFTDLTHYVRSGDFMKSLYEEAKSLNEVAFALGVISHYYSDNYGHSLGTNRAVPVMFPKLRRKFGEEINYYENKTAHRRMEFSFDVVEIARGSFAPENYHELIGFEISNELLARAFLKTYGLELKDVFVNLDLAISSFRWTVKELFPGLVKAAWATHKKDISKNNSHPVARTFTGRMRRKEYIKQYRKPGVGAYAFSFFIRIIPKIGPLKALQFKAPNSKAEEIFIQSFHATLQKYAAALKNLKDGNLLIANRNDDTGIITVPCEYVPADRAYSRLLLKCDKNNFKESTPDLRNNIWDFYKNTTIVTSSQKGKGRKMKVALTKMRQQ